ncbi:hypothetical protein FS837_012427 [Tulasnella sp. UAMH 9824]|nr:hypothetical protein FS837_012427 [Tulasnella sp. UAMH 9824]
MQNSKKKLQSGKSKKNSEDEAGEDSDENPFAISLPGGRVLGNAPEEEADDGSPQRVKLTFLGLLPPPSLHPPLVRNLPLLLLESQSIAQTAPRLHRLAKLILLTSATKKRAAPAGRKGKEVNRNDAMDTDGDDEEEEPLRPRPKPRPRRKGQPATGKPLRVADSDGNDEDNNT